ncbi:MAG TPA: hypothetical protein VGN56_02880 [Candidatus Paceibacterota bacterium]|jgi:hypothetical protein|nr:hypothetical protein [Candidatus Paceibacterota bacterium]
MKHKMLHDAAKFLSGLVLGDFITLWWLSGTHALPVMFLGMTFTQASIAPGLIFDAALFLMLIYYGWHLGKMPAMRERTYHLIAGVIFGIVAIAHLLRVVSGSDFVILGWSVPLWLSWIGTAAAAFLSYMSLHLFLSRKS